MSIVSLVDGIYTVGEVEKESASDECNRLNVGDDILAIDEQSIVSTTSLLNSNHTRGS